MNIITEHSLWYGVLGLLLAVGGTFALYRKSKLFAEVSAFEKVILVAGRFLLLFALAILLLNPLMVYLEKTVEKPVLVFAQDNSSSVVLSGDSTDIKTTYWSDVSSQLKALEQDFEVHTYTFGDQVKVGEQPDFNDKSTDISALFDRIKGDFVNRNLGAVVLATDGNYNRGFSPEYGLEGLPGVYTIGIGDTIIKQDIRVKSVIANKIAYLGNDFPVEVGVATRGYVGEQILVQLIVGGEVKTDTLTISKEKDYKRFRFIASAKEKGYQRVQVKLTELAGEKTYKNNTDAVYIDVIDGHEKVLILTSAPHPDVNALRGAIESNKNYQVETATCGKFNGVMKDYNLVIFHQIPSAQCRQKNYLKEAFDAEVSMLFVMGGAFNMNEFNGLGFGAKIKNSRGKFDLSKGVVNEDFRLFKLTDKLRSVIPKMPPMNVHFGKYEITNAVQELIYKEIGGVATQQPIFAFNNMGRKIGFITGEGIWRWKLAMYEETNSNELFDELITKSVRYLSVEDDKRKFKVDFERLYIENESIVIGGQLYDESYEPVTEPDVELKVLNKDTQLEYDYRFNKKSTSYRLTIEGLPAGNYEFVATTEYDGKAHEQTGSFKVAELKVESLSDGLNRGLLNKIALNSGGDYFSAKNVKDAFASIKANNKIGAVSYFSERFVDVVSLRWLFFILLAFVSAEWFIRKRNGGY